MDPINVHNDIAFPLLKAMLVMDTFAWLRQVYLAEKIKGKISSDPSKD